jgi:hypothetical protein
VVAHLAVHGEDGAHRDVGVDVRRAVERVEEHAVVAGGELVGDGDEVLHLFRRHPAQVPGVVERLEDHVVGELVELAHLLALHVHLAGVAP